MSNDLVTLVALFRYGIISPLLEPGLDRAERARRVREILAKPHLLPEGRGYRTVSGPSLRRWLKAYREGGFEALKPRARGDRNCPRAIPPEVLQKAVALKEELPQRSVRQIIDILVMDPDTPVGPGDIKPSTLARHLKNLGKTRAKLETHAKAFRRFEQQGPNLLWQSDVKYGPYLPDPKDPGRKRRTYLIAFLDDYSRLVCHGQFYWAEDLPSLLDCFKRAILKRGIPAKVFCDNGAVFASRQFELICATLGIRHISARPYAAESKGKIERFWRTVEQSFLPELGKLQPGTLQQLNDLFWAWLEQAYHHLPNRETGQTPAARFAKGPGEIRLADPLQVAAAFLWREKRKVDKTACFSLQGNRYEVDSRLAGKLIEVRYDPFDLTHLQVFYEGERFPDAVPHQLVREHDERVEPPVEKRPLEPSTGLSYLELLKKKHDAETNAALGRIRFWKGE